MENRAEERNIKRTTKIKVPITVTSKGRILLKGGTLKAGRINRKEEKNQPESTVPIERRKRALARFGFSSPIGDKGPIEG